MAILLAAALLPALLAGAFQLKWQPPVASQEGETSLATARQWGDKVLWVDARPRAKFEHAHIPGAILLNEDEWVRLVGPFLDAWESERTVVVYCDGGTCDASQAVAKRIKTELGIDSPVWVLQGGWDAWRQGH